MPADFAQKLADCWRPGSWCDVSVLVAVSGGPDSVALLRGLAELRQHGTGRLIVGHFNHRWRGSESDQDAAFVAELAGELGLAVRIGAAADGPSDEAAARHARYQFLQAAAQQVGARYVAMGHTADDQAETILHRVVRGTGLNGLAGIPRTRELTTGVTVIRPLLSIGRGEILAYLAALQQPYRQDATNRETRFTRNRIRHDLLPRIARDYNPQVKAALLRLGQLAFEAQQVVQRVTEQLSSRCLVDCPPDQTRIDCRPLGEAAPFVVRELLISVWQQQGWPRRQMSHEKWDQLTVLALSHGKLARVDLPGQVSAERQGNYLLLARCLTTSAD